MTLASRPIFTVDACILSLEGNNNNNPSTIAMPSDDVLQHSQSDIDYYEVLGGDVHPGSTENEISRAYRKKALAIHPDKRPDDPLAATRFHQLSIAFDVLSDAAAKAAYDNARAAREMRKKQVQMMDGKRKRMKDDLERRESGAFKRRKDEVDAEEILEREIRRLAEDGRKRRMQREEEIKKAVPDEESELEPEPATTQPVGGTNVPEIQRTVVLRWLKEGLSQDIDKERLATLFQRFGHVDSTVILSEKRKKKKGTLASGAVVFSSVVSAHKAVEDKKGPDFDLFQSIKWAAEAPLSSSTSPPSNTSQQATPITPVQPSAKPRAPFPGLNSTPITPLSSFKEKAGIANGKSGNGLRKVPSFSFSSANLSSSTNSPFAKGAQSPSLEEITMIRLRNAERKRQEEKIRREEAESAAHEKAGAA
jgi:DnaJ homolog subfamily C member 17